MSDDPYLYPCTSILKNKLGIRDERLLDLHERELVTNRAAEGVPAGDFDLRHLRAIHRHLFHDVYAWAGELRTLEISKDGDQFQFRKYIETGMADVHRRIVGKDYLVGLSRDDFAGAAGEIMGDVNYVHPFREGNGRTQLQYLKQLALRAGHSIDLRRLDPASWVEASRRSQRADYAPMARAIEEALMTLPERDQRKLDRKRER